MKARKVKGLDPASALGDNAERIVRVRLDEMLSFDTSDPVALHDLRIAAKRLRYVLEVTHPSFGPFAAEAVKFVKALQDVLGDVHDCDVQIPEVREFAERVPDATGLEAVVRDLEERRARRMADFERLWSGIEAFRERLVTAVAERPAADYAQPG